ncbi:MAG: glycosyltransferase family 4 protein [Sphingomonas sp.]|nr:glycosyltransferase family 4 protein [Sphingomonas sp.]
MARAIARNSGEHQVHFLLNGLFQDQIDDVISSFGDVAKPEQFHVFSMPGPTDALRLENGWRRAAAHTLYEAVVHDLAPDALLIGSLFEGGNDDTVVGVGVEGRRYVTAVILYDLIPLLDPATYISSSGARAWYHGKIEELCQADLLLGISHSACREAIDHLSVEKDRVHHIGAAADDNFNADLHSSSWNSSMAEEILAYHGISRPFVMHASAFDARKNFDGLIAAFGSLSPVIRDQHQLVLVCKLSAATRQTLLKAAAEAGLTEDDVILTGFVPDDELRVLYANCKLFAFPSFHEGFGLPVVEAMWCGAPVIGSSLSSVPEVVGREDAQFDPRNPAALSSVLSRALTDEDWRQELVSHAAIHARRFCWDDVARRAIDVIDARLDGRSQTVRAENVVDRVAGLSVWPGPTDSDLLATARSLAANEHLSWPLDKVQ